MMILNSSKYIYYIVIVMIFIIVLIGCNSTKDVTESEAKEIEAFMNSFYDFLDTPTELKFGKKWFLNNEISFSLANTNLSNNGLNGHSISSLDFSEKYFQALITSFFNSYGKREKKELLSMHFTKTADEMPVKDLFVIYYRVKYEGVETHETFFIKKVGAEYKVYHYMRYFSSDDGWQWKNLLE